MYDAWGVKIPFFNPDRQIGSPEHRNKFNGKEYLSDLGWYEYGFRIYDPVIGRFNQVDPLAMDYPFKSSYDYAENDPVNAIDLDGLEKLVTRVYNVQRKIQSNGNYSFKLNQLGPQSITGGGDWSGYKQNDVFYYNNKQYQSLNDIMGYKESKDEQLKVNLVSGSLRAARTMQKVGDDIELASVPVAIGGLAFEGFGALPGLMGVATGAALNTFGRIAEGLTNWMSGDKNKTIGSAVEILIEEGSDLLIDRALPGPTPKMLKKAIELLKVSNETARVPTERTVGEIINPSED
jgi:RHS repeat-associated protein